MSTALLLVLPTNEKDFYCRITASDYLRRFKMNPALSWRKTYLPEVAEPLQALVERAKGVGVAVFENASLVDLSLATRDFQTVMLVSHWKGPGVLPDDLVEKDPMAYRARVNQAASASASWLRREFAAPPPGGIDAVRQTMAKFIETQNVLRERMSGQFELVASDFTIKTWNRDELNQLFSGLMHPGNRIEFTDDLYAKESVAAAVDRGFKGILDLTTCTSTVLSDHLARMSRGAYFSVQFDQEQEPALTCLFLERALQLY